MIEVIVSWIIILCAAVIYGSFILSIGKYDRNLIYKWDSVIITGILFLTWYAEFFSIFYKVGVMAQFILLCGGVGIVLKYCLEKKYKRIAETIMSIRVSYWKLFAFLLLITAVAVWTCMSPENYDTLLYHAQAIQWIEKYGVVCGLGNFHNRLAHNSAFMCLQALFSFSWHFERSLHTVNGFLCAFFIIYAVMGNHFFSKKKAAISDFIKVIIVFYIVENRIYISSPGSDMPTMLMVLYICSEWCACLEKKENNVKAYGFLTLLGVYTVTLKLSAIAVLLFAVYPLYKMVCAKKWCTILKHFIVGTFIFLPFCIRNVILSGYILYPYPEIDLFNVDWKMPADILKIDSREIMVWGRGIFDVEKYNEPFGMWFPNWYGNLAE